MKVGSLFTGYGGLDMAVGGDLAWYAEIEPAACKVLSAHYPNVPNLGDITTINWAEVEPVDILTGGYPCQPFSHAGQRKGKNDERHLWPYVLDAIRGIRPRYAILENVAGHRTLGFADVLADLAEIGWAAEWGTFRASDVGAAHRRERLFIVAYADSERCERGGATRQRWLGSTDNHRQFHANSDSQGLQGHDSRGSETPTTGFGHDQQGVGSLAANASGDGHGQQLHAGAMAGVEGQATGNPQQRERSRREYDSRGVVATADTDMQTGRSTVRGIQTVIVSKDRTRFDSGLSRIDWGKYAPAIQRWESVLDRPAPAPTVERKDKRRLNPQFVEWMMGLPDGWVTGHGLSAAQELKMLGNGVVPQQAHAAITQLMQRVQSWAS